MRKNIAQLRAIYYVYRDYKHKKMLELLTQCKQNGINIEKSRYDEVTIKRCTLALNTNCNGGDVK